MHKTSKYFALALSLASAAFAYDPAPAPSWDAYADLVGSWDGVGGGQPGQATAGGFTFTPDLEKRILVRKNFSDYPARNGRPAAHHEDLMVIYAAPGDPTRRATYWDNEGHVIAYSVEAAPGKWTFTSDPGKGPRFRLTYTRTGADDLKILFEMSPPGKPDAWQTYVAAAARRARR